MSRLCSYKHETQHHLLLIECEATHKLQHDILGDETIVPDRQWSIYLSGNQKVQDSLTTTPETEKEKLLYQDHEYSSDRYIRLLTVILLSAMSSGYSADSLRAQRWSKQPLPGCGRCPTGCFKYRWTCQSLERGRHHDENKGSKPIVRSA